MELLTLIGLIISLGGTIALFLSVRPFAFKFKQANEKEAYPPAGIRKRLSKIGIGVIALGFFLQILAVVLPLLFGSEPNFVLEEMGIVDGPIYKAKAFNWDKEQYQDVRVEFHQDECTLYFPDAESRTLTLLYPGKTKDPKKIEAVDEERDVFWDITIKLIG